MTILDFE